LPGEAGDRALELSQQARQLESIAQELKGQPDLALHIRVKIANGVGRAASNIKAELDGMREQVHAWRWGKKPAVKGGAALPHTVAAPARAALLEVEGRLPELRAVIDALALNRPELFAGPDRVTGRSFAEHLAEFVANDLQPNEVKGLHEFLMRLATRRF